MDQAFFCVCYFYFYDGLQSRLAFKCQKLVPDVKNLENAVKFFQNSKSAWTHLKPSLISYSNNFLFQRPLVTSWLQFLHGYVHSWSLIKVMTFLPGKFILYCIVFCLIHLDNTCIIFKFQHKEKLVCYLQESHSCARRCSLDFIIMSTQFLPIILLCVFEADSASTNSMYIYKISITSANILPSFNAYSYSRWILGIIQDLV